MGHLLLEDGGALLLEDGGYIELDFVLARSYADPGIRYGDLYHTYLGDDIRPIFPPPPGFTPTLASTLQGSHRPIARVEFLDTDLHTVLYTLDGRLVDGTVTTDRAQDIFSSASVTLVDDDGTLAPGIASYIWPDRLVRISRGAFVAGAPVLVPLITGVISDPGDGRATGKVSFSVASRFYLAKRQFTGPVTIAAAVRGKEAIRQLCELGGLGSSDALYDLDDGAYVVASARTFDANEEVLGAAIKWAFDMGCDLWPDASGVTRMQPFVDVTTQAPKFDFGEAMTVTRLERNVRSQRRFNRQEVRGIGPDGYSFSAEAKITNPTDPLFWTPDRDFPARPYPPNPSAQISDVVTAQAIAERLLFESAGYEETIPAEAVPVPLVGARDVVTLPGTGNALLDSASIPIYKGAMRMQSKRVRQITL